MGIVIQIRTHPKIEGVRSKSLLIKSDDVEATTAMIKLLFNSQ